MKLKNPFYYLIEKELQSLFLLAPIIFAFGIITYFNLDFEPNLLYSLSVFVFLLTATLLAKKFRKFFLILLYITFFTGGFFAANLRTHLVNGTVIVNDNKPIWVRADAEKIEKQGNQFRLTLNNLDLWRPDTKNFPPEKTPEKIRVIVKTKMDEGIKTGDRVAFKAMLTPPAENAVYPRGYDFGKVAYFNDIGGVGYAISVVKLFEKKEPNLIDKFQDYFYNKVKQNVDDSDLAGIIISQITADRVEISEETKNNMRDAGLGHLIAISGLNMSVAMVWLFLLSRTILAFFPNIALQYDIKKLSVFIAIIFGVFYLLVTGMPVSAVRAFLMVMLFFVAVLFDRFSISLHPVALAAFAILIIRPEEIMFPSFQLSFAAVVGLIGMYEIYDRYLKSNLQKDRTFVKKWLFVFLGIVATTLFTSITTAPFGIMNFGRFQNYGIFANMIGVPVVSILVLPFSFLSIFAMPLGIEKPFLIMAEFGARIIRETSYFISEKQNSVSYLADIPNNFIIYVTVGFLILFIFKSKIRWLGIPVILLGYFLIFQQPKTPDFVINESTSLIAMKQDDGNFKFFGAKRDSFVLYQFTSKLGVKRPEFIRSTEECNRKRCVYKNIVFGTSLTQEDCKFDYIINMGFRKFSCEGKHLIDRETLKTKGTHVFYLKDKKIVTASDDNKPRLWNKK